MSDYFILKQKLYEKMALANLNSEQEGLNSFERPL
jgi:hypothetical protein